MLTLITLAIIGEEFIQLGLAGVAIGVLAGLLYKALKYNKEKDASFITEVNKRDEIIVNMQEKTVEALTESTIVVKEAIEVIKDATNAKTGD